MTNRVDYFPELKVWTDAAAERRFLLPRCGECGRAHWYPRPFCPFCYAADIRWQEASGEGSIYAFTNGGSRDGSLVAYVTLAEGPTILTSLVDISVDTAQIDQAVRALFREDRDGHLQLAFGPAPAASSAAA